MERKVQKITLQNWLQQALSAEQQMAKLMEQFPAKGCTILGDEVLGYIPDEIETCLHCGAFVDECQCSGPALLEGK